jgi:RNA polymerase sigma-70 factor (ECF subfamily)
MEYEYGKPELFEQIVLDYQNLIFTVCFNIVRDSGDAENLAQETFLTAYRSLSGFRGENLKAWLCRIAVNKSIDYKRKHSKIVFEELEAHSAKADSSGEELFEQKELSEKLNAILTHIPEKYSSVIRAFYYDLLPVKEIARKKNLPEKTVETQLYRARKLIKERWGDDEY